MSYMKNTLITLMFMFPISSNAGYWVGVDIVDIRAFTDQTAHFIVVRNFSNPEECSVASNLVLNKDDVNNWKMVHSLIMSGFISDKNIQVRTAGCDVATGTTKIDGALIAK